jgi:hypothetical protein
MRRLALSFVAALAIAGPGLRGGEISPPAPAPGPIESAKRDYDAIKASRTSVEQQKLQFPAGAAPELRVTGESPPADPRVTGTRGKDPAKDPAAKRGVTANWLVNAMNDDKTADARDAAGLSGELNGREQRAAGTTARKAGETDASARRGEKSADAAKAATAVVNPLENYLASWMKPGDYQLLRPSKTSEPGAAALGGQRDGAGDLTDQINLAARQRPMSGRSEAGSPVAGSPGSGGAPPNPYLADSAAASAYDTAPRQAAAVPASAKAFSPAPAVDAATAGPVAPPPAKAPPGDLLKARDDARYFPQLKRF